jgi:hypothetical protein
VVSTVAIHDEFARRRPDLLEILYCDFWRKRPTDEEGPQSRPEDAVFPMPVFSRGPTGAFTSQYSRTYVEMAAAFPGVPEKLAAMCAVIDPTLHRARGAVAGTPFSPSSNPADGARW